LESLGSLEDEEFELLLFEECIFEFYEGILSLYEFSKNDRSLSSSFVSFTGAGAKSPLADGTRLWLLDAFDFIV
jgi:hypothetical protein